jgi:hypothetical protein
LRGQLERKESEQVGDFNQSALYAYMKRTS